MLSLKPLFTINRVTVFGDHADPDQFYYLPETVHISTDSNGQLDFTLLMYLRDVTDNPAFSEGQSLGGGFLTFSVDLSLDDDTRAAILRQARRFSQSSPKLATALFRDGDVRVVALDATNAPADGQVRFVENLIGTTKPSLLGDLKATFSLQLSQEGAALLEAAYTQGGQPIGVVYDLKFLGLRPAFDITIKADYKRIYDEFNVGLHAQYMFLRADIEAGFQKLVQDKAIEVTVNSYTDDADTRKQLDDALKFFENNLLQDFFTPSLPLPQQQAALNGLSQALNLGQQVVGRNLSQANSGAALTPGLPAQPSQPANKPPTQPPPSQSASNAGAAAMKTLGLRNPNTNTVGFAQPKPQGGGAQNPQSPAATTATQPAGQGGNAAGGQGQQGQQPQHPAPAASPPPAPPATVGKTSGGGSQNNMTIGFTLSYKQQEELKTIELNWKEAAAVEQQHTPNGTFGMLLRGINRAGHIIQVDLDNDFFQRLKVMVDCPTPFAAIGLSEIKVHFEYGDRGDGQPKYVNDVELKPDAQGHITPQEFTTSLDAKRSLQYRYQIDFYFDPSSAIRGQKTHYTTDMLVGMARTLSIDPETYVGFLRVGVTAGKIDFDAIDHVQVALGYDDDTNNFHVQDTFILAKDKPSFEWLVRLTDPQQHTYWYELTYFLKGNQVITIPRQSSIERDLAINAPWRDTLQLLLDALLKSGIARLAVQIDYEDTDAGYQFSYVKRISSDSDVPASLNIPILNAGKRSYNYQITGIGSDGVVHRSGPTQSQETYLLVSMPD